MNFSLNNTRKITNRARTIIDSSNLKQEEIFHRQYFLWVQN
jgi:hypothetical protein